MERSEFRNPLDFVIGLEQQVRELERGSRSSTKNRPLEAFLAHWTGWSSVAVKSVSSSKQIGNRLSEILNRPDSVQHAVLLAPPDLTDSVSDRAARAILDRSQLVTVVVVAVSSVEVRITDVVHVHWAPPPDIFQSAFPGASVRPLSSAGSASAAQLGTTVPLPFGAREESGSQDEAKLIFVGRGGAGKTSLVQRLSGREFRSNERKTEGIAITTLLLPTLPKPVWLNVWDFGGQEIMHATHQFFMTSRTIYVLVLSGREGGEDEEAIYWLKQIESFGEVSPVIVVQNKYDEHRFELNTRGLRDVCPAIRDFIQTDCETGRGLEDLRKAIVKAVEETPGLRVAFRDTWVAVRRELDQLSVPFLSYDKYLEICAQNGVEPQTEARELADALNRLGIALNYLNDGRLHDTSVLRPEWITGGIYRILNAHELAEKHGELCLSDLQTLLPEGAYPVEKHFFLMELMRKFSLCFAVPETDDRYLVPELLSKEEPEAIAQFEPAKCLNFEYHYAVLPPGLLPRFIVRSRALSNGKPRWRSGVILTYEKCSALVMARTADDRVIIRIMGGDSGARRRLLAIIRYSFEGIHEESGSVFEVTPVVPVPGHPSVSIPYEDLLTLHGCGVVEIPFVDDKKCFKANVDELLNGVDVPRSDQEPLVVFFSYSHKDSWLREELQTHLTSMISENIILPWHDGHIRVSEEWNPTIADALNDADIILLLVSADFLSSEYIRHNEIPVAMKRHADKKAHVVPIIVRNCDWKHAPFAAIQAAPKDGMPVKSWPDRDDAWVDVVKRIRELAESIQRSGG